MNARIAAIALVPLVWLGSCTRIEPAGEGGGAAMLRNLSRASALEIVVRPGPAEAACWKAAERISRERGLACRVLSPAQRGESGAVRIVVAGPGDELGVSLVRGIGIDVGEREGRPTFSWRKRILRDPSAALLAVLEDPDRPGLPLTLLYGNDEASLDPYVACVEPGWKPWLRIYDRFDPWIEAPISSSGTIDESRVVLSGLERQSAILGFEEEPPRADGLSSRTSPGIDAATRDAYLETVALARSATRAWAGPEAAARPLTVFLYERPETLSVLVGDASLSGWNPVTGEVHALLARGIPHDAGLAGARALARELLGPPSAPWIEDGAAVHAAGSWWGRELEDWIAWLRAGRLVPPVEALVDPLALEANSPHLILPLRAALFRFLVESRGETFVRALWAGKSELRVDVELERGFGTWLDGVLERRRPSIDGRREVRRGALLEGGFLAGVGIEEPGPAPDRGFGSASYERSLEQARAIGARAAALTCFLAAEPTPTAAPAARPVADGRGATEPYCGDLRLFAGLCQARAAGLRTLLQPRLLTAPGGTLAGTGPQGDEKGWQKFFDGYSRFVVHAALLGELAGADGLSLGGGMTASTTKSPGWRAESKAIEWRLAGWQQVVRTARGAFSGTLTWAADSVIDASELAFWEPLDVVTCDLAAELDDRSLSWRVDPRIQINRAVMAQLLELERIATEHGKPLVLTQAGFRSGGPEPGAEQSGRITGEGGFQAMQLEILGKVLANASKKGSLDGAFLWRWSSDSDDRGINARDGLLRPGPVREAAARVLAGL